MAQMDGVGLGRADVALGGVDAGDLEAQPRHGFAQQPAAAADVEQAQAFERPARARVAAEADQRLVADEGEPHRIEPVQRRELAVRRPPLVGQAREALDLRDIDTGALGVGHGPVLNVNAALRRSALAARRRPSRRGWTAAVLLASGISEGGGQACHGW